MMMPTRPQRISDSESIDSESNYSESKVWYLRNAEDVLRGLNKQRMRNHFCDVVLVADKQRIPAHRALLALSSPYFHAMFTLGMREQHQEEVELVGMSYIGLKTVVDSLYTGKLPLDEENIDHVLEAAHFLQVGPVVEVCGHYLKEELSEDNYLHLQELALLYSLKPLETCIDDFILARFAMLSFTPEFSHSIPLHKLTSYLSSGQVQHDSEEALLQATLQWLSQTPERAAHTAQLLSHIRLPLVPAEDLMGRVLPAVRALLTEDASCKALLEEAEAYHARPSAQPLLQTGRTAPRGGVERLLLIGGEVSERGEELSANVCWLDGDEKNWVVETALPSERSHHRLAVLGGFIFTAGGSSSRDNGGGASCNLHRYDPRHNKWTTGAPMNEQRADFYLGAMGECLIAVGGRNDTRTLSSVEVYHPAEDSWSYVAELPRSTYAHAGTVYKGVVCISGGHDSQIGPYRRDFLSYNSCPDCDVWVEQQPMSVARGWHCMASLNHLIYAIGGSDDNADTTERFDILEVESFNPSSSQWTRVSPLLLPNSEAGLSVWKDRIFVLGGYSWEGMEFSRATQVYYPWMRSWLRGPDLPNRTAGASACVCTLKPSPSSPSPEKKN
ncbi:hypothetical protein EPR50_G00082530 [Perca flavescens]|uniref:Kelch-like protein 36 n=2 Tax=Perca flavescens TaxID=8167 RepID=A0A484D0Z8_PERFV|nr:kelch-like protein 36 isoform X1 [Perca flavescens]TDH09036.1 hypothetical protein EPR50_G00082530 [Perca flavescens]